ncbi:unnamed protein product [Vitrella brassicaformis CCMP3155]|uniref:Clu domain-containing protein n=6 Tax=Vitrella brassicaformis TaxID=1169539 RepID=A0A0G4FBM8_VITBC|nr:unnamed protein product [Vitrella brassicaformis CCMP3155]|eukprot:CEM10024.1 unnamed protein product [Vitrella brassicaformis CCMP3155]
MLGAADVEEEHVPVWNLTVELPNGCTIPFEMSPAATVGELRAEVNDLTPACFLTAVHLECDGAVLMDEVQLRADPRIYDGATIKLVDDRYTDAGVRRHVRRLRQVMSGKCTLTAAEPSMQPPQPTQPPDSSATPAGKGSKAASRASGGKKRDKRRRPRREDAESEAPETQRDDGGGSGSGGGGAFGEVGEADGFEPQDLIDEKPEDVLAVLLGPKPGKRERTQGVAMKGVQWLRSSGFNPPPSSRRLRGEIWYYEALTLEGTLLHIVATENGFTLSSAQPQTQPATAAADGGAAESTSSPEASSTAAPFDARGDGKRARDARRRGNDRSLETPDSNGKSGAVTPTAAPTPNGGGPLSPALSSPTQLPPSPYRRLDDVYPLPVPAAPTSPPPCPTTPIGGSSPPPPSLSGGQSASPWLGLTVSGDMGAGGTMGVAAAEGGGRVCFTLLADLLAHYSPAFASALVRVAVEAPPAQASPLDRRSYLASLRVPPFAGPWVVRGGTASAADGEDADTDDDHPFSPDRVEGVLECEAVGAAAPQRDWNEELQRIREMPSDTEFAKRVRDKAFTQYYSSFTQASGATAMRIRHGMVEPYPTHRSIHGPTAPPHAPTVPPCDDASKPVYVDNGLLFTAAGFAEEDDTDTAAPFTPVPPRLPAHCRGLGRHLGRPPHRRDVARTQASATQLIGNIDNYDTDMATSAAAGGADGETHKAADQVDFSDPKDSAHRRFERRMAERRRELTEEIRESRAMAIAIEGDEGENALVQREVEKQLQKERRAILASCFPGGICPGVPPTSQATKDKNVYTPAVCVVDYGGVRFLAESLIPGALDARPESVVYGLSGKREFGVPSAETKKLLWKKVGRHMAYQPHDIVDKDGQQHRVLLPCESKLFRGTDGRQYLTGLQKATPRDLNSPSPRDASFILRPEIVCDYLQRRQTHLQKRDNIKKEATITPSTTTEAEDTPSAPSNSTNNTSSGASTAAHDAWDPPSDDEIEDEESAWMGQCDRELQEQIKKRQYQTRQPVEHRYHAKDALPSFYGAQIWYGPFEWPLHDARRKYEHNILRMRLKEISIHRNADEQQTQPTADTAAAAAEAANGGGSSKDGGGGGGADEADNDEGKRAERVERWLKEREGELLHYPPRVFQINQGTPWLPIPLVPERKSATRTAAERRSAESHAALEAMAGEVKEYAIPELCCVLAVLQQHQHLPMDSERLKQLFHRYGVNMRYLGHVLSRIEHTDTLYNQPYTHQQQREQQQQQPHSVPAAELLLRDIIGRSASYHFSRILAQQPAGALLATAAHLLQCLFGDSEPDAEATVTVPIEASLPAALHSMTQDRLWRSICDRAKKHFSYVLPASVVHCTPLNRHDGRFAILRTICRKVGICIKHTALRKVVKQYVAPWPSPHELQQGSGPDNNKQQQQQQAAPSPPPSATPPPTPTPTPPAQTDDGLPVSEEATTAAPDGPSAASDEQADIDNATLSFEMVDEQQQESDDQQLESHETDRERDRERERERGTASHGFVIVSSDLVGMVPVVKCEGWGALRSVWSEIVAAQIAGMQEFMALAIQSYENAIKLINENGRAVSREGYICHSGLGHVHMHAQHFDQAAHHFATALLILEALEGADHPDAIEMHQNLGLCCIPILQTFQKHTPPAVWNSYRLRCLRHFKSALLLQRVWACAENQPLPQLEIIYFYIKAAFISFSQQALGLSGGTEGMMGGLQRGAAEDQQQAGGLAVMAIPYVHTLAYYMAHMLRNGQHAMQDRAQIRYHECLLQVFQQFENYKQALYHARQQRTLLLNIVPSKHEKIQELDMLLHQLTRKAVQTAKRGTPYGPFASIATGGPFPYPECSTEHRTYLLSKLRSALGQKRSSRHSRAVQLNARPDPNAPLVVPAEAIAPNRGLPDKLPPGTMIKLNT